MKSFVALLLAFSVVGLSVTSLAQPTQSTPAQTEPAPTKPEEKPKKVSFKKDIKPILVASCVRCHNNKCAAENVNLEDVKKMKAYQGDAKLIAPGKPDDSLLIWALEGSNGATPMPIKDKALSKEKIDLFKAWITQGAKTNK